ncbi:hypothetical protein Vi05172_g623 [Venturia inaequalis]|nr:hypothetical protein Vi05172_g623 [Venturia inaequalis]
MCAPNGSASITHEATTACQGRERQDKVSFLPLEAQYLTEMEDDQVVAWLVLGHRINSCDGVTRLAVEPSGATWSFVVPRLQSPTQYSHQPNHHGLAPKPFCIYDMKGALIPTAVRF